MAFSHSKEGSCLVDLEKKVYPVYRSHDWRICFTQSDDIDKYPLDSIAVLVSVVILVDNDKY